MNGERTTVVAWVTWLFSMALVATAYVLAFVPPPQAGGARADELFLPSLVVVFVTAGAVIVSRVADSRVGWIYLISGPLGGLSLSLSVAAKTGKIMGWDHWEMLGAIGAIAYFPWIFSMVVFPVLLYPDGRLPSSRWRVVAGAAVLLPALWIVNGVTGSGYEPDIAGLEVVSVERVEVTDGSLALWPVAREPGPHEQPSEPLVTVGEFSVTPGGDLYFRDGEDAYITESDSDVFTGSGHIVNPIQVVEPPGVFSIFQPIALAALVVAMFGTVAAVIVRFRVSHGVERLQMKWLAFSASVAGLGLLSTYVIGTFYQGPWLEVFTAIGLLGTLMIPVTTGMAIVRYRLYDIDRLISRTVVYAILVALLAAVYASVVFLASQLLPADDSLTVAISTLTVAALFNPFRRGLQRTIDHRLHRSRYDADKVVGDFTGRLSHGVDLQSIEEDLLAVLQDTVQPEVAGLWIRHRD